MAIDQTNIITAVRNRNHRRTLITRIRVIKSQVTIKQHFLMPSWKDSHKLQIQPIFVYVAITSFSSITAKTFVHEGRLLNINLNRKENKHHHHHSLTKAYEYVHLIPVINNNS